jgi:FKBP-type peptidyl-prolyl cis-trans isomerase SlyD
MVLKKNDFIEINFTGKTKEGSVFDSNIEEDLREINEGRERPVEVKPFRFSLGQGMFLKGIDEFLIGKEISKEGKSQFDIELSPEKAFGNRNQKLIQMIPMKTFREHGIRPMKGVSFNFDGRAGKVLAVSGGRVIVDFNHVLAGKTIDYKIEVLRKIEDVKEKVESLNDFFFRKEIPFEIKDKILLLDFENIEQPFKQIAKLFKDKYEEILGFNVEMKGTEKKED